MIGRCEVGEEPQLARKINQLGLRSGRGLNSGAAGQMQGQGRTSTHASAKPSFSQDINMKHEPTVSIRAYGMINFCMFLQ